MVSTPRGWSRRLSGAALLCMLVGPGLAQNLGDGGPKIHAVHLGTGDNAVEAQELATSLGRTYGAALRGAKRLILVEQTPDAKFSYHLFVPNLTEETASRLCERFYEAGRYCDTDYGSRRLHALQGAKPPDEDKAAEEESAATAAWLDNLFALTEGRLLRSNTLVDFLKRQYREKKYYRNDAWSLEQTDGEDNPNPYRIGDIVVMRVMEAEEEALGLLVYFRAIEDTTNQDRQIRARVDLRRNEDDLIVADWRVAD